MKGQVDAVIPIILIVISGLVGLAVIDGLVADTNSAASMQNESKTLPAHLPTYVNMADGIQYTLNKDGSVDSDLVITTNTSVPLTLNTNYTINYDTGVVNITSFANQSAYSLTLLNSYNYIDSTYYSSGISRLIAAYLVPLGLLSVFGFLAFAYLKRE